MIFRDEENGKTADLLHAPAVGSWLGLLISVPASGDRDLSPVSANYNPNSALQTPSMQLTGSHQEFDFGAIPLPASKSSDRSNAKGTITISSGMRSL
jgi:hypothetical protein